MSETYRRCWSTAWLAGACLVLCLGVAWWSTIGVVVLWLVGFVVGSVVFAGRIDNPGGPMGSRDPVPWWRIFRPAARWASLASAIAVTAVVTTWLAFLLALVLLASSPLVLGRVVGHHRGPADVTRVGDLDSMTPEGFRALVRRLDLVGLCAAWRASLGLLDEVRGSDARSKVVMMRQEYLDEMERRDSTGFQAWLEACEADPASYLREGRRGDGAAAA